MINNLKKNIRTKNNYIFWITNPNLINIEIAVKKNFFDIFVIDNEHSLISINEIRSIIIFLNSKKIPVFIRFAKYNIHEIPKFLDFGIDGIIAADVSSLDQLKFIKDISFYPKKGLRGVGLGRMNDHGENFVNYLTKSNKNIVFLPMIEKNIQLTEIEKIYKDSDVDGCLIGPYDLSMSIGKPGNFYNSKFQRIENFILKMKNKYKKVAGLHFMDHDFKKISIIKKKGFNFLPILTDVQFFKRGINFEIKK
jgi:2-dehydro-3-deoxyglucarate aldolase